MHIVIIGMGPAAISAVQAIRKTDRSIAITLISAEDTPPYSPPCLGDFLLTGQTDKLFWQGTDFGQTYQVACRAGDPVTQVSTGEKKLTTAGGTTLSYDKLLIASGSSLYAPVPGAQKPGVWQFKNLAGAKRLRELAAQKKQATAVIVGGGFIGVEIALYLAKLGMKPTLLNRRGWIMPRLLDPGTSAYVDRDLRRQGVDVRLETEGREFAGEDTIEYLLTRSGEKIRADAYLAATGVKPNLDFLQGTDVRTDEGVIVDEYLQTSCPDVFACGDVAQAPELISGEKKVLGLYPVAVRQGETAGRNALGCGLAYPPQPSMNSLKGLGFKLIVAGRQKGEETVCRDNNGLKKFFIKDGRLQGFVLLGDVSGAGHYMSLLQQQRPFAHVSACPAECRPT